MKNYLAFDLGASNGRAILGQFDGEKIVMKELHRFENNYVEMNGVYYWDTPYLYSQLKQGLLAFKQGGYGELDSFGIDTWGVDYGLLDRNGHLAGVPRSYRLGHKGAEAAHSLGRDNTGNIASHNCEQQDHSHHKQAVFDVQIFVFPIGEG